MEHTGWEENREDYWYQYKQTYGKLLLLQRKYIDRESELIRDIYNRTDKISSLEEKITGLNNFISEQNTELKQLQDELNKTIKYRIRRYRNDIKHWLSNLFSRCSESFDNN